MSLSKLAKKGISLFQSFFVFRKREQIMLIGLRQHDIQITAAQRRIQIKHIQIFGMEKNGEQIAQIFTIFQIYTVFFEILAANRLGGIKNFEMAIFIINQGSDARIGVNMRRTAQVFHVPIHQVILQKRAERFTERKHINGFQKVSFAGAVRADKHNHLFVCGKFVMIFRVITKIFEFEAGEFHGDAVSMGVGEVKTICKFGYKIISFLSNF